MRSKADVTKHVEYRLKLYRLKGTQVGVTVVEHIECKKNGHVVGQIY